MSELMGATMNFEFIGKDGKTFGKFAVKVDGNLLVGDFESNPDTIKYNGVSLGVTDSCAMYFKFDSRIAYPSSGIERLLEILRMSHAAVFHKNDG